MPSDIKIPISTITYNQRQYTAEAYQSWIVNKRIVLPQVGVVERNVWHLFFIRSRNRMELIKYLNSGGVNTLAHYPIPPHRHEAHTGFADNELLVTERIHLENLGLPMDPIMSVEELKLVISVCKDFTAVERY